MHPRLARRRVAVAIGHLDQADRDLAILFSRLVSDLAGNGVPASDPGLAGLHRLQGAASMLASLPPVAEERAMMRANLVSAARAAVDAMAADLTRDQDPDRRTEA